MVLELIAVYGIIIGTIVGTGHALHHMHDEPHSTSSVEVLPVHDNVQRRKDMGHWGKS